MFSLLFNTLVYEPLYNGFIFLIAVTPFHDVGLAVILLTLLVRIALFPVTHKTVKSQSKLRQLEPEINRVKKETENDKQAQAKKVMELYKAHGVNPFSGCLMFLVQTPFILALFWLFNQGLTNGLSAERLYSFVTLPQDMSLLFLGVVDISKENIIIALIAGISQYFQIKLAMPPPAAKKEQPERPSFKDEFAKSFQTQARYVFPVMVFFLSYTVFPAAVALYWVTSNLFSIGHELLVRRRALEKISNS
ncbi:MAG: YidC/Oxa1 family membrane protein insertase [Parcubacteria group bacterium]|nr:YidC/Oxa1 family membrane protein insertase [Parcubacteria group bacterium]